jgi:gluconolactonase
MAADPRVHRPKFEVVACELGFTEGPVIRRHSRGVAVVSVSLGYVYEIGEDGTVAGMFVGNAPNGLAEVADGRLFIAQTGSTSPIGGGGERGREGGVQVLSPGGEVSWLSTEPTSPNDICVGPDGWVYCSDPTRPMGSNDGRVWRVHPDTGEAQRLAEMDWYPNGLGFGLDDDVLFVAHTQAAQIVRYPRDGEGGRERPEVVVQMTDGHPDGFTFDTDGNLVICAVQFADQPGTIQRWTTSGELLDVVQVGPAPIYANLALDPDGTAWVTGSSEGTVLRVDLGWEGLPLHPFR